MDVLLVEDEIELAEFVGLHLEAAGYSVKHAPSGEEALDLAEAGHFDLVLLDLMLPGIDGNEVLGRLRNTHDRTDLPIVVVSALGESETITAALRLGANDYVTKPVNVPLLLTRCETILQASQPSRVADRRALEALTGEKVQPAPELIRHCSSCITCMSEDRPICPTCNAPRPEGGWPGLPAPDAPYLGELIDGRYFMEQKIAEGGQGAVYRCRHLDLERSFAAKFVNIHRDEPERAEVVRRRILGEIKALERIESPHVVRIHDVIQIAPTVFVLLMDYVTGSSVEDVLNDRRTLPVAEAVDIGRQVAAGLCQAHELGYVHRDVKPSNVMVERLPGGGNFVRILDFGFVHTLDRARDPNRFEGTIGYSAPEQLSGEPLDHRADIYALGVTLFDMLTGAPPFRGSNEEIIEGHLWGKVPYLADKLGRAPAIIALDRVLRRMLAKKAADRFRDAYEVIQALDDVVDRFGLRT